MEFWVGDVAEDLPCLGGDRDLTSYRSFQGLFVSLMLRPSYASPKDRHKLKIAKTPPSWYDDLCTFSA
jgi:hypothetical protein